MARRSHLLSYRFCKSPARDAAVELLVLDQTARRPHLSEESDKSNIVLSFIADACLSKSRIDSTLAGMNRFGLWKFVSDPSKAIDRSPFDIQLSFLSPLV